jgi:hypothetical protein
MEEHLRFGVFQEALDTALGGQVVIAPPGHEDISTSHLMQLFNQKRAQETRAASDTNSLCRQSQDGAHVDTFISLTSI